MTKTRLIGLITGLIHGTIIGGLVLGMSWLLKTLFSVPSSYSLAALVSLPWMILVVGWWVFWLMVVTSKLFNKVGDSSSEVEVAFGLLRWALGGRKDAKSPEILGTFAKLAIGGSLLGATRWAFHIESDLVMSLIGGTVGLLLAFRKRARAANFKWELVRLVVLWMAAANPTFVKEIPIPSSGMILVMTAGLGGMLGLLIPPALAAD